MRAWHFLRDDGLLRDGLRPAPPGEWLEHNDALVLCRSGLHASIKPLDALQYAPGSLVCRVEMGGHIIHGEDKLVASRRKIVWIANADAVLRHFARLCALDVAHLWDAPEIVVRWLRTGDESIRAAARDAAREAARAAARDEARVAAWAAAWEAARVEARAAAWEAARVAARVAAWEAARVAARVAAWAAAWAAAREEVRVAARARQNRRLHRMLLTLSPQRKAA